MKKHEIIAKERSLEDDRRVAEEAITLAHGRAAVSVEFTDTEIAALERALLHATAGNQDDDGEEGAYWAELENLGVSYETWRMAFMKISAGERRLADARRF